MIYRFFLAFVVVLAGWGLRLLLTAWIGPGLPPYITFYPIVMSVALLAGFWPGMLATILSCLLVDYYLLQPPGSLVIKSPVDLLGILIFMGNGIFVSVVAELYRKSLRRSLAYEQEKNLRKISVEKELLADLLEHASQAFVLAYPDGRIGRFNQAYRELTGYSTEELLKIDWPVTLTPSEWREHEKICLEKLHRTGQPVCYEKEYIRKDGSRVPVELLVHLVRETVDSPEYYYAFISDITERRKLDLRLKENEQRYRGVIENTLDGFFIADKTGRFIEVNAAYCRMTGFSREEVLTMSVSDVEAFETPQEVFAHIAKLEKTGSDRFETAHKGKGGKLIAIETIIQLMPFSGGQVFAFVKDITERKQSDELLRQSEERLRLAQDKANIGIWDWDVLKGTLYFTPELNRLYGLPPGTIKTYQDWREKVHPEDIVLTETLRDEAIARHGGFDLEFRVRHISGEYRWIAAKGGAVYDKDGKPLRIFGVNIDITGHKIIEENIRKLLYDFQSEKDRLSKLIDSISDEVWLADTNKNFILANPAAAREFGLDLQKLAIDIEQFARSLQVFRPDMTPRPVDESPPLRALKGEVIRDQEEIILVPSRGELRYRQVNATPIKDPNGRIIGAVSVVRDITALKKSQESRELLATIVDSSHDAVFTKDLSGNILTWNSGARRLFGYLPEEIIGRSIMCLIPPERQAEEEQILEKLKKGEAVEHLDTERLHKDGTKVCVSVTSSPLSDPSGRIIGASKIVRDITERVEAEKVLKRDKATLTQLVKNQAHHLMVTQAELEQSKRLSDIGTLAAQVAHELRNPLAAISITVSNIRRKLKEDASLDRYFNGIEKKIGESDQIINNLLFYSRLRRPHLKTIEIFPVLEECVELAEGHSRKGITFKRHFDILQDVRIEADTVQIQETFSNMLNNAADAVSAEIGVIEIEASLDKDTLRICIKDNGVGISKEDLERIFDPFFSTKAKGTGLGLTVCNQIIKMHGGLIGVESTPGQGSSFVISLPVKQVSS